MTTQYTHFNSATTLPPIECPLVLLVDGKVVRAHRPTPVHKRGDDMVYITEDGTELVGQYPWTYP